MSEPKKKRIKAPALLHDPDAYAKRCQPRSESEALSALDAFFNAVRAAANEHGVADAFVVTETVVSEPEGNPTRRRATYHCGSSARSLHLATFGYGYEKAVHEAVMRRELEVAAEIAAEVSGG